VTPLSALATAPPLGQRNADLVAFDVSMPSIDRKGHPFREHDSEVWAAARGRIECSADTWDWWNLITEEAPSAERPYQQHDQPGHRLDA